MGAKEQQHHLNISSSVGRRTRMSVAISRREFDDPLSLAEQKAIGHYHECFRTGASAGGC
jgi:hypothetical protein